MAAFKLKIKLRSTGRLLIVAPVTRTRVAACWWVHLSSGLPADYLKGSKRVLFAATPTLRGLSRILQVAWSHIRLTDGGSQMTHAGGGLPWLLPLTGMKRWRAGYD